MLLSLVGSGWEVEEKGGEGEKEEKKEKNKKGEKE